MRFIVVGASEVGINLAGRLSEAGHSVSLIERSEDKISELPNSLDIEVIQNDACKPETLLESNISTSDYLIALTDSDETNACICLMAKLLNPSVKKIARIRNLNLGHPEILSDQLDDYFDLVINPDKSCLLYTSDAADE